MSIADKQMLLKNLEKEFSDMLTNKDMTNVLKVISSELEWYELNSIERKADGEDNSVKDDLLEAFISAKAIEGRSKKTISRYRYILEGFLKGANLPTAKVTVYHLRKYLADGKEKGLSDMTLNGYRDIFCSYFNWLQKETLLTINPCANLNKIKHVKEVKKPFTDIDIERLKSHCKTNRDRAIVCFLLSSGCRIQEVVQLNKSNIDFQNLECTVLGKGNKERVVYIDNITAMYLKKYFTERQDMAEALFIGKGTERMTPGGIRAMLTKLSKESDVDNVHPHRFRRTLATNLINRGMTIQEVAYILGHDKIDTTMKYVFIEQQNVKNNYRKYSS